MTNKLRNKNKSIKRLKDLNMEDISDCDKIKETVNEEFGVDKRFMNSLMDFIQSQLNMFELIILNLI